MPERAPDYQAGQAIPGTVYRVHRVLGAGGMGTVYDVEDTTVGKRYVLKTLHGNLAERTDLATRLAREARALAKLQHPNIVEVYTSGTTQDGLRLPYYVMERLQGQSLRTVLERKGRLTIEQALDIGIDLLDALDHAHEFGIIHRDVKPDNIFITRGRDGRSLAKLLDFGIIKLASAPGASLTMATGGRFIGTFRYAPPEQILGRDVTPQSDLYAAGLVLYEMIAGRGPFDDFTGEMEIGKAHIDMAPPMLSRFGPVPAPIEQLIMSALQKDASLRPRDAFAFASALRDLKKQLAGVVVQESKTSAATVEQVVAQPVSAARPATPFGAQATNADLARTSGPDTRISAPGSPSSFQQTLALGAVRPQLPAETFVASPLTMRSDPAAVPPQYGAVDRGAATRSSVPEPAPRPHYDTAPIPLAVLARPESSAPPQSSTFGAHTTEASQRKKASRFALVLGVTLVAFVGLAGIGAVLIYKQRHATTATTTTTTATSTPVATPTQTATPVATDSVTISNAPLPTLSGTVPAVDALPVTTTTTTTTTAAPVVRTTHTASASPTHTTAATMTTTTTTTATPPPATTSVATTAPTTTHHRPGSGL